MLLLLLHTLLIELSRLRQQMRYKCISWMYLVFVAAFIALYVSPPPFPFPYLFITLIFRRKTKLIRRSAVKIFASHIFELHSIPPMLPMPPLPLLLPAALPLLTALSALGFKFKKGFWFRLRCRFIYRNAHCRQRCWLLAAGCLNFC